MYEASSFRWPNNYEVRMKSSLCAHHVLGAWKTNWSFIQCETTYSKQVLIPWRIMEHRHEFKRLVALFFINCRAVGKNNDCRLSAIRNSQFDKVVLRWHRNARPSLQERVSSVQIKISSAQLCCRLRCSTLNGRLSRDANFSRLQDYLPGICERCTGLRTGPEDFANGSHWGW